MKLKKTEIPLEFLTHLPEGIKVVNRGGSEQLVIEKLSSRGGTSLMSDTVRIHGEPSVRIGIRNPEAPPSDAGQTGPVTEREGLVFIDAYWGSHAKLFSFVPDVSSNKPMEAFVPETGESLMIDCSCDEPGCECKRHIHLVLPGGTSSIDVCARFGCPGHHISLADMPGPVSEDLSHINYFGAGEDDLFQGI